MLYARWLGVHALVVVVWRRTPRRVQTSATTAAMAMEIIQGSVTGCDPDHSLPSSLFAGHKAQYSHRLRSDALRMGNGRWIKYMKILRKERRQARATSARPTIRMRDREQGPSDRNHQHLRHDGHSPRPHLTLLPSRLRCAPRQPPSFYQTPGASVVVIVVADTNPNTHTRTSAPCHHPIQNPHSHPLFAGPQRRGPDCDTRASRPRP